VARVVSHVAFPKFDRFVVFQSGRCDDIFSGMASATKDDVGVALKLLNDFLRLQVPNVHLVVFAATHDPFATRHGEVGEDTVFLVLVPLISLEAFALGVIPQLECVVQRRRQNVFAVRGEFDKTHRRIVVVNQRLQALAAGCIPNSNETVVRRGDDEASVSVEMNS